MEHLTSLVTLASLVLTQGAVVFLPNEHCQPRPTLVALDHPNYNYFPFFVLLHRCGGSFGTTPPSVKECVATQYIDIHIEQYPVVDMASNPRKKVTIKRNHTQCGYRCVKNQSDCNKHQQWNQNNCNCDCSHNSAPPEGCPVGFTWNSNDCLCECANAPDVCGAKKNWSKVECRCVTNVTAPRTGRSRKRNQIFDSGKNQKKGVSSTLFVVFIVVEFAVLYIVFDAILYHRQAGIFYRIHLKLKKQAPTFEGVIKDEICRELKPGDPNATTVLISGKETAI